MAQHQVVLLKEAQSMRDMDKMEGYFDEPLISTILVMAFKADKVDKRKKFYKSLEKNASIFESKPLYDNQVAAWIFDYIHDVGYQIDDAAAHLLAEFCGTNLSKINNEVQKIKANLGERRKITIEDIQNFSGMNRDFNVFELQKALASRNADRVIQIFQYFANNPKGADFSLPYCLTILYNFYSKLWVYQSLKLQSQKPADAVKALNAKSEWAIKEIQTAARIFPAGYASRCLKILLEYDLKSKGYNTGNTDESGLLKELAFKLLQG
jgi:DNA polymerase-3 subunit delta